MTGPTHEMLGVTAAFGASRVLDLSAVPTCAVMVAAYSTSRLPDQMEGGILPHRGPTHRVWMTAVVTVAVLVGVALGWRPVLERAAPDLPQLYHLGPTVAAIIAGGVMVGYGMHLVADSMTRSGLRVGGRRVHLLPGPLRIRTGSAGERAFQVLVMLAVGLYVYLTWGRG